MMLTAILPAGRWKLLRALWMDGAKGSVRALAKQNQMSYSSAHAELQRLGLSTLARSVVVGNSLVYEANKEHPNARELEALVRASAESQHTRQDDRQSLEVMATLKSLGAPLRVEAEPSTEMVAEEAVARGLRLTHHYPVLARAFPVLLARRWNELDRERLRQQATALGEKQTLGFFLELTGVLSNNPHLHSFSQTFKDRRVRKDRDFFEGSHGKYARALADHRTPQVAQNWHFRMNMDLNNFQRFFSKHCGQQ